MKLIKHFFLIPVKCLKHIFVSLGLYPGSDLEEQLNRTILEQKQRNFLDDIKLIRTVGDYVPDYNAAPKFSDYRLIYTENKKDAEVKWQPKTVAVPRVKYNSITEWQEALRLEAKESSKPTNQLNILFSY